jgi:hypothetical protein
MSAMRAQTTIQISKPCVMKTPRSVKAWKRDLGLLILSNLGEIVIQKRCKTRD